MTTPADKIVILPPYVMANYDQQISQLYREIQAMTFTPLERLKVISHFFLGQPYVDGALGEGPDGYFDQSPLYRTDAFDCVTFVNTVLALWRATDLAEFKQNIVRINYANDHPDFVSRHHFLETDWLPHNTPKWVCDITYRVMDNQQQPIAALAKTIIDKADWFRHLPASRLRYLHALPPETAQQRLTELHHQSALFTSQANELPYLPLSRLFDEQQEPVLDYFNQIPSGVIIIIVRPDWAIEDKIGTRMNVSHLGFAWRNEKNELIFREASLLLHQVADVSLIDYLKSYVDSETIKGINIQNILEKNHEQKLAVFGKNNN